MPHYGHFDQLRFSRDTAALGTNIAEARNVTVIEQIEAEKALRESEARFRELADHIGHFAWTADHTGWIYWYNKRWHDYTGTTLEEVQSWGWQKVHHPDHVDRVVERIRQSFETGTPWEDTFPLRGSDGNYRWFLSRALPIRNEAGEVIRGRDVAGLPTKGEARSCIGNWASFQRARTK